ncbi:hypothetical protein LTR78_005291 [Recurvomyces mirabilis]|uniref:Cell wall mannoprotein PIR1-like C-terminal domain-containing protein n=1 Tax=Recurvomyces mirabilis TaxID=574656 RepID=A0AAE0WNF2_9PEZI|nr:hypothetical protein LTR78_005291 [Recurvomyces mirabilis]KAK5157841.1 hypothetical protein LTS14_003763 [Recurvomyces mirabilis]
MHSQSIIVATFMAMAAGVLASPLSVNGDLKVMSRGVHDLGDSAHCLKCEFIDTDPDCSDCPGYPWNHNPDHDKRDSACEFTITAYTASAGLQQVQQLGDGQNRIGQTNIPLGYYHLVNGGLIDSHNRGCILTPPTTQWQCDEGATPTYGFDLTCNGTLTYEGDSTFYSCPTGDHDGWNLYSKTLIGQEKCVPVWLRADSCFTGCATSTPTKASPVATTSSKASPKSTSWKTASTTCTSSKHPTSSSRTSTSTAPVWKPVTMTSTSCSTATITPSTSSKCTTSSKTSSCTKSTPTTSSCTTSSKKWSSSCTTSAPAEVTKTVFDAGADATADANASATWTWDW